MSAHIKQMTSVRLALGKPTTPQRLPRESKRKDIEMSWWARKMQIHAEREMTCAKFHRMMMAHIALYFKCLIKNFATFKNELKEDSKLDVQFCFLFWQISVVTCCPTKRRSSHSKSQRSPSTPRHTLITRRESDQA